MTIPNGYAQVNVQFGGSNAPTGAEVTLGFDIGGFSGDPTDLAQAVSGAWETNILPLQSISISLLGALAKFGPDATGPSGSYSATGVGGDTGPAGSPAVAVLVRKNTASGGRAGRGRMFVPGIAESSVDPNGQILSGKVSALQSAFDDFLADLTAGSVGPVVLHQPGSPISTPSPITSFTVSNLVATQRQRVRR